MTPSPVQAWKQRGLVFLWRYLENERNYPGWHFTADDLGATSFCELLRAMGSFAVPSHRTLVVTPPTTSVLAVPNNRNGAAPWVAPDKWRIAHLPEPENAEIWRFD